MTFAAKHLSISIDKPADIVYEFVSNPENLPKWAEGLSGSIKKVDDDWIADSPMGIVKIKFASQNKFGILDHDITLPNGMKIYVPMRVFPNKDGSEIIFTIYQLEGMTEDQIEKDIKLVEKDLKKLKEIL